MALSIRIGTVRIGFSIGRFRLFLRTMVHRLRRIYSNIGCRICFVFRLNFFFFSFFPPPSFKSNEIQREREIESKFAHRFPRKNRRNNMETLVARDEFACLLFAAIFLPFFRRKLARYSPSVSIYLGTNQTVFRIVLFLSRHFYALVGPFFFFLFFLTLSRTFQNPRFA